MRFPKTGKKERRKLRYRILTSEKTAKELSTQNKKFHPLNS
jgi:hypothetical protein